MINDFLDDAEVAALGLARVGRDVHISRHALLFGPEHISLGDHVRIDAFAILSASPKGMMIGNYVHIAGYVAILGGEHVELGDFASLSPRSTLLTSNDDFSGRALAGPTVPIAYRSVTESPISVGRYAMVGSGAILLPGVLIGESAGVGAHSLVKEQVPPFTLVAGVPARRIGSRSAEHQKLALRLAAEGRAD